MAVGVLQPEIRGEHKAHDGAVQKPCARWLNDGMWRPSIPAGQTGCRVRRSQPHLLPYSEPHGDTDQEKADDHASSMVQTRRRPSGALTDRCGEYSQLYRG